MPCSDYTLTVLHSQISLTFQTSIICTRRMDSPACCWERFLSWCMYFIYIKCIFPCSLGSMYLTYLFSCSLFLPVFSHHLPLLSCPLCSQLLFVVGFTVFLANCVDYDILFANKFVNHTDSSKVTLPDAILPMDVCSAQ